MPVYKKKNRWYIDYFLPDGRRKREVVKIRGVDPKRITRQDALKALSIRRAEMADGTFDIQKTQKSLPFEQLAAMYLEWAKQNHIAYEREEAAIKALRDYFGGKNTNTLNPWHVEKYKSKRKAEGKMPSTINKELGVLRLMFNVAVKGQLKLKLNKNPILGMKLLKIPNKKMRVLKDWEFQSLYEAATPHLRPIVLCAYLTGMRRSEIANLKWDNVDLETRYIHLEETKTNEPRSIPIHDLLLEDLKRIKKTSKSDSVFPDPTVDPTLPKQPGEPLG